MKFLVIQLIRFYQKTLSPDHGFFRVYYPLGYCKFHPSCSEYCKQSVEKHGVIFGLYSGLLRVLRCRPGTAPAVDLVN